MVEFLVATMLATSVLFVAITMLGKFNDVRNKTLMGSRYAAWERSVWLAAGTNSPAGESRSDRDWFAAYGSGALQLAKSDREIQREFMQRTVAVNGTPIQNTDRDADRLPASVQAMWADYSGRPLLGAAQDVALITGAAQGPATTLDQYTAGTYGSVLTATGGSYAAMLDLPTRNLQSATLSIAIAKDSDTLKRLWNDFDGLTFVDTNVLLTNTWLPEGSANGLALFTRAAPAANADLIAPSLYQGLRHYAPEIDTLEMGRIQHEVLPKDRLSQ
ncbi:MAG TPA: hypothetical protein VGL08_10890 [Paraburkholderia sp.]|jgi:hypothetical protein